MITKVFGKDFRSVGGALTLDVCEVSDNDPIGGVYTKTHEDGWTITGEVQEDYHTWVNKFKATHKEHGVVEGDFEDRVYATSEKSFNHFYTHHKPTAWDYQDI